MTILFLLIGISLTVALGFLGAFLWAARSGQFDDTYTPGVRVLFEEDEDSLTPVVHAKAEESQNL